MRLITPEFEQVSDAVDTGALHSLAVPKSAT